MSNLNSWYSSLFFNKRRDLGQFVDMLVLPDSQIGGCDSPSGFHRGRLRYHEARATDSATSEVDQVPIASEPIMARVFAHRRDGYAVTDSDAANC